jgi:hypothetical protein
MLSSRLPTCVDFTRSCARPSVALLSTLVLLLMSPKEGFAQSHWGVSGWASPGWTLSERARALLASEDDIINIEGKEFAIGFVRGSTLGGDIGVSYVRKPWKDGFGFSEESTNCFSPGQNQPQICLRDRESGVFQDVMLNGVEVNWFYAPRFGRIKNRVQIGLNVGGGIATFSGEIIKTEDHEEPVFTPGPGGGSSRIVNRHSEETLGAEDELLPVFPLFKIELMGAIIATPAVKIKVAGGTNFPGVGFRVVGVYLFGAR